MRTIGVRRGETEPTLIEKPRPEPDPGEALVRTLRVGVDGTDHHVIEGAHGGFPDDADHLVLGHEAVGVVEDPNGTPLDRGQVVAPTIRRPPGETNAYFERGEPDMAPPGAYRERGIEGAHGFMAEYFTDPHEYLVEVPESLADVGFLLEPASITAKAMELVEVARSTFTWRPTRALVLGNGSLGLLTLAMLGDEYEETYCLGRRDRPDPTISFVERLGATYVDSRETPVDEIAEVYGPMDFVYEATGHPPHALESLSTLAPGGAVALLGIPEPGHETTVDAGQIHQKAVLEHHALVGSVCSHVRHFEEAVERLRALPDWVTDSLVTECAPAEAFDPAFESGREQLKSAVEFSSSLDA